MNKSGILDNHKYGKVGTFLAEKIAEGSELSFVSAYFTIYAYEALEKELDSIDNLRFLFGEPSFLASIDPGRTDKKSFRIEDEHLKLANRLKQKAIARRCAKWIQDKVEIRSIRQANLLHGKLYHIHDGKREHAVLGSSNFTARGLGVPTTTPNIELNLTVDSDRDRTELKEWFDDIWNDDALVEDVKKKVLQYLKQLYGDHAPEFIYFKTLYHIFEKFLSDQDNDARLFDQIDILDTEIWRTLFEFQKDGAKGAIHKINNHNGCVLADSVGLGKTYTALAVIKYYELRNHRVLVLCPKRLRDNWTTYLAQNNSELNPFLKDRFAYTVLSHTDLSRESGKVDSIDLTSLNWANFDLVVIDESHNFRNNNKGKLNDDGEYKPSRYERLMKDIIQAGIKTKVMLLSATPVNNNLQDLRNQIYLITEGKDDVFSDSFGIRNLSTTLAEAQKVVTEWTTQTGKKDAKKLINNLSANFFTLLDELTIARSRKHIKRYYPSSLEKIGKFPERKEPQSIHSDIDLDKKFPSYEHLSNEIYEYQLSLFNPSKYLHEEFKEQYASTVPNFSQAQREGYLIGMMRVNFLKRLESSVHSFNITMERTIEKIETLQKKIEEFIAHQAANKTDEIDADKELYPEPDEQDDELAQAFEVGGKLKFKMEHLNVEAWQKDLAQDKEQLTGLAKAARKVTPERDAKLTELKELIKAKVQNPSTNTQEEENRKVIVFCAFADTANYLYENLCDWARESLNAHIALVSGGAKPNQTTFGQAKFDQILVNFSPRAKQRDKMTSLMPQDDEIDILIATDCISEGQNLQDCDTLINYDIHWNPVRIIQRFGRIDRIGSLNSAIQLVNFWPTENLDKYIKLKHRVEARMALVDIAATAEDNVLQAEDLEELIKEDLGYRDKQLQRLKNEVLDLEDFDESLSLNEFTLDDFRMELLAYIESQRGTLEDAPFGLYAVVPPDAQYATVKPGVIYCLKQRQEAKDNEAVNSLQPYFLVYIHDDGNVRYNFTSPKQILEIFRALCQGKQKPYQQLCDLFDQQTQNGKEMSHYDGLLNKAVSAIVTRFSQKNASNLFGGRDGKLVKDSEQAKKADDFELITWLVIKDEEATDASE